MTAPIRRTTGADAGAGSGAGATVPARWDPGLWALLLRREWFHHPWRHGAALLAVALGVALAWSVHLINNSALAEFSQAVRSANGQPDLSLRGSRFDDAWFDRVAADRAVESASPVLEVQTYALAPQGQRLAVQVLGVDALTVALLAPALLPRPAAVPTPGEDGAGSANISNSSNSANGTRRPLSIFDPQAVFANEAARQALTPPAQGAASAASAVSPASSTSALDATSTRLSLQSGPRWLTLQLAGSVAVTGPPTLVMDLAAVQQAFSAEGQISRIDLRLLPGTDIDALLQRWALPAGIAAVRPGEDEQSVSNLSRAYRVNLTVLALVALFVGAFLVFSVVSLSVAQRTPTFALLGVLGLGAGQRRLWVLAECALLGAVGSVIGLAGGTALAVAALHFMAGDLGGGYFPGIAPALQWSPGGALAFAALGVASAVVGGWWPARQAQALSPALALKGMGSPRVASPPAWPGLSLLVLGGLAALLPPVAGLPLAAYAAVAALLLGGVSLVPTAVSLLLRGAGQARGALTLLALQRARYQRQTASAAVAGVVASLALSVALTVMVASFRTGVGDWLSSVLPADLYARTAGSSGAADQAWLPPDLVAQAAALPGVQRVQASRTLALNLRPGRPAVALVARPLEAVARPEAMTSALPLLRPALPLDSVRADEVGVYVSEAMVALYGAAQGSLIELPLPGQVMRARVLGVWRDYARQFGTVVMAQDDYQRLTGDRRLNDLALWLAPGAELSQVQQGLRDLLPDPSMLQFASSAELRRLSLRIFDRSFAVTYYLQAVAITIGLIGVAASLSAQVLARRKEFGLLSHLGLTRGQIIAVVAGEGSAWVAAGTLVGLVLGLAVSGVLVWVVNPQSFHWTMDLVLPWGRLLLLSAAVWVAGTLTAGFSARSAAARQAVLSVKEDW